MKPVARREDIVEAVEAARTVWVLTDIDRMYSRDIARRRPIGWTRPGLATIALLTIYPCPRSLVRRSRMSGR